MRRCWTEISLDTIEKNYRIFEGLLPLGRELMAVVKADAYGHGDREVADRLYRAGCRNFAVSNIEEAVRVREACRSAAAYGNAGKTDGLMQTVSDTEKKTIRTESRAAEPQILILGYTPLSEVDRLVEYDITQAIPDESYAERLALTGKPVKAQFAIDTGMNRIGLNADEPQYCESYIRGFIGESPLIITGMFTHLCVADTPAQREFTEGQIAKFTALSEALADLKLPYMHCLNTAGGIWYTDAASSLMRLGISLYGLKPDAANQLPEGVEPALEWKSVIAMVKEIEEGETVGYGRSFRAEQTMRIATIPVGYADGYHRSLSNCGYVLVHGQRAPIVGRVCMDQLMIDVTQIPDACAEDEVVLLGRSGAAVYTADDMAQLAGTIGYEIVCDISKRVERNYV